MGAQTKRDVSLAASRLADQPDRPALGDREVTSSTARTSPTSLRLNPRRIGTSSGDADVQQRRASRLVGLVP